MVAENCERTLIFDVETTGLPQKNNNTSKQPYIIQLSYVVINVSVGTDITYNTELEYNNYIRINDDIEIPPDIVKLTKITKEKCLSEGIPIEDVLCRFYEEYMKANRVVSHNIAFDSKMILIEIERNYAQLTRMGCGVPFAIFNPMFNKVNGIIVYCTMMNGKDVANIMITSKKPVAVVAAASLPKVPRMYKKQPKLIELYRHLYPEREDPIGLHDSLVDTKVCMECYIGLLKPSRTKSV
jgi:DNA polymerase-3 subunit alpha